MNLLLKTRIDLEKLHKLAELHDETFTKTEVF